MGTTRSISSIVVGTDMSPCSASALRQAMRIAAWSGASLHVVHVIDTVVVIELERALSELQRGIREGLLREAREAWTRFARTVPAAAGLPLEISINNRVAGILARAREDKADLLVMGAYGDRSPDVGIGTVATACVRQSPADVLLVRDIAERQAGAPFSRIVVGVDFSDTSLFAVHRAAMFARRDGAHLTLLHVAQPPWTVVAYGEGAVLVPLESQRDYMDGLERRVNEFCESALAHHPGVATKTVVREDGGHRFGLAQYAHEVKADLVVLGTRGRTNLHDVLLGSTAERVLAETRCSVLAVKPE